MKERRSFHRVPCRQSGTVDERESLIMEPPAGIKNRKPPYPWFSFLLPLVLFSILAVASARIFALLAPRALPIIFAGLILLLGVAIAGGVYASYRLWVNLRRLEDDLESRERLSRETNARLVVLEEERMDYERSILDVSVEAQRRVDAIRDELAGVREEAQSASTALAESEDRWTRLLENHPEGVIVTVGRRIVYVNKAAVEILGARSEEDVVGTDVLRYSPQSLHEQLARRFAEIEAGSGQDPIEYRILGLDGTERFVEAFGVQINFRDSLGVQTVVRDVTNRRNAERDLRKYAERLAVVNEIEKNILVEKKPGEIADHALSHLTRLVECHRAIVMQYHEGDGEVLAAFARSGGTRFQPGASAGMIWIEDESTTSSPDMRHVRSLHTQSRLTALEQALRAEDSDSYLSVPLVIKGQVFGALVVASESPEGFTDAEIQVASEIADLLAVALRQYQVEQERISYELELLTAKEHAEEMVRLKTAFLTNMSHEIRTPLTGIIGFAQILTEEIDEAHSEFVHLIEQSGRRLLDTINSVLDLARLESNRMQMSLEPINVAEEARRSVKLLTPLAEKKDLWLKLDCPYDEVWVELDSAGLDRIMNNLIGNAIKFTTTGGIVVRINKSSANVELTVQDTGIGMSEAFIPVLFEEFRQESSGANRSHEGSGMGLSITRKLVEIMGGSIAVDSKKGVGTTFTITFPTEKPQVPLAPDRPPVHSSERTSDRPVILVVEDQEEARFLLQYTLHEAFDLRLAPDMAVAAEIARGTNVDVVLLDVNLGGIQASMADVTRFRKTGILTNVPIVGMTAYPWQGDRDELIGSGFSEYISKPFEVEIVTGVLNGVLESGDRGVFRAEWESPGRARI